MKQEQDTQSLMGLEKPGFTSSLATCLFDVRSTHFTLGDRVAGSVLSDILPLL